MLSTTYDFLRRKNPYVDVRLFGQEINPESYAICLADMLIKGQDVKNIMGDEEANTLKTDCFPDQKMRLVIMNPPFGTPWGGKDAPEGQEKKVREENKKGGRFEHGLPGTGDAQLLFMQHAINKLDEKNGRAAIITNGSPLFSGGTTSGESQIRRWMLEEDLIEAIIALPTQLFYNTDIGIYIFILSRNKRPDRRGKVQLINAVDMWKPLRKSLGKKRREIDRDSMVKITELYSNFEENQYCKIFPNEEFMYKEYAVYQPLQRRGVLDAESIERLRTSSYFTSNSSIFNETDFEQLKEMNPRSAADEKKYQKYLAGQQFVADVLTILEANRSDRVFMDYGEFEKHLKSLLGKVEGMSASRLTGIAMVLAVMDKTAVVQKDRKGEIVKDTTTKDTEIIKLTQDPEKYFEAEVYPHVPDAIWAYEFNPEKKESATNKEKLGAEFPFTRFFYEYKEPEKADDLLAQFMKLEKSLSEKNCSLAGKRGSVMAEKMKPSGIDWIGDIPNNWETSRIKYHYQISLGKMLQPIQENSTDTLEHYMCSANITWAGVDTSILKQMWFSPAEKKQYRLLDGDLLVSEGGDVAVSCIWRNELDECYLQNAVHRVRQNALSDNRFIYYWLFFLKNYGIVDLICNKATIAHFTKEKFGELPICVMSIDEQVAIADFLDKECAQIDSIAADLEKQIALLQQYKKSLIYEYVTGKKRVKEAQ